MTGAPAADDAPMLAYEIDGGPSGVYWEVYAGAYDRDTYLGTVRNVCEVYALATSREADVIVRTYAAWDRREREGGEP